MAEGQPMVPCSYLRVYQPLDSFPRRERARWSEYIESGVTARSEGGYRQIVFAGSGHTGILYPLQAEHAYFKMNAAKTYVCPWRVRLRILAGLLAFRNTLPVDVADAFVPEDEAEKAIDQLDQLRIDQPDARSHIATAAWQVPLRWFVAFDDSERLLDLGAERATIRYETDLANAAARVESSLAILRSSMIPHGVVQLMEELGEWMGEFPAESLLELDYASVAGLFSDDDISADHSAAEVWACLHALRMEDFEES